MSRPRTLSDQQILDVARWKRRGKTYEQIASLVGCTAVQAKHYVAVAARDRRRFVGRTLAHEIAAAKAEAATKQPFKSETLIW